MVAWCNRLSSVSGLTVQSVCTQGWWGWECDRLLMYGTLGHIRIQVTIMTFKHADSVGGTEVYLPTCTRNKTYTPVVDQCPCKHTECNYITLHFGEAHISTHKDKWSKEWIPITSLRSGLIEVTSVPLIVSNELTDNRAECSPLKQPGFQRYISHSLHIWNCRKSRFLRYEPKSQNNVIICHLKLWNV